MIRRALETGYNRTLGAARDFLIRNTRAFSNRIGWIEVLYILLTVGFSAGFVNAFFFPVANQNYIIYPAGGAQTLTETVIDSFVILMGGAGIYITYLSGRQTTKARMVNLYLALSLFLVILAIMIGIQLSNMKG